MNKGITKNFSEADRVFLQVPNFDKSMEDKTTHVACRNLNAVKWLYTHSVLYPNYS